MYIPRRLIKYVKDATPLSVVRVREAWQQGRIQLLPSDPGTGQAHTLDTLVFASDVVLFDGTRVTPASAHYTAILNKPRATISTARDPRGKGDLSRWLAQMPTGTFPVGRLDRDTTGLLLFTTSGDLANAVLRPEHHTDKLYWLWLNESFSADDPRLTALEAKDDPRYDGAKFARVGYRTAHYVELELTLNQGKHRQIRRMCRALDLRLLHLHRKQIGPLDVAGLPLGEHRQLTESEVEQLWQATGGYETMKRRRVDALRAQATRLREQGLPNRRLERWLSEHAFSSRRNLGVVS